MPRRRTTNRRLPVALLAVALLASACNGIYAGQGGDLDGDWVLTSGQGPEGPVDLPDGTRATLRVDGQEWGGQVCNHYFATAHVDGQEVTLSAIGATQMGCEQPLMDAERRYHAALAQVSRWEEAADVLRLTGPDTELVYQRAEPVPDADLVGTTWQLESLAHGVGPDGTVSQALGEETLHLDVDGTFFVRTGCNPGAGTYEVDGEVLRADLRDATDKRCGQAEEAQEEHVFAVLTGAPTVEVSGDRLVLTTDAGALHYRAAD